MSFFNFLGSAGDLLTDLIPGGDLIDDIVGFGVDQITGRQAPPSNGRVPHGPVPMPQNGQVNEAGCRITLPLGTRTVAECAPGYVAVDRDRDGINETCMLKEVAVACGLWKPRPKPVMTASDRKALSRAASVMRKVDTVVKQTNSVRGQARLVKKSGKR